MVDCPNIIVRESLPELLHDMLGPEARERVQAHLDTCPACTDELSLLQAVMSTVPVPVVNVQRIVSAVPAYQPRSKKTLGGGYLRLAAGFIIAAVGVSAAVVTQHHAAGPASKEHTTIAHVTPVGVAIVGVSQLSDEHLEQLIDEVNQWDGMPSEEPEPAMPMALQGGA